MNNSRKMLENPLIRKALQDKLTEIKAKKEVVKVDAELVDDSKPIIASTMALEKKKPKFMDLATSEHYFETFLNKTPKEINNFIDRQSDMLMMYSKNAALELLAKALEDNDPDALEMYLKVVQASAVVAQEKLAVKKLIGVDVEDSPKQYVGEKMSPEEWEKTFKPGQPIVPANEQVSDPIWIGPTNKSVN